MLIINFASNFFFQTIHAGNAASGPWFTNDQCGKTIVQGTMDAGINNVIYMELHSGPKMAKGTCRKTIVAGTTDRGSTASNTTLFIMLLHSHGRHVSTHFLSHLQVLFIRYKSWLPTLKMHYGIPNVYKKNCHYGIPNVYKKNCKRLGSHDAFWE
jgi:hypothetical protein